MKIIMPQLGETVSEGAITHRYKKVGDPVRAGGQGKAREGFSPARPPFIARAVCQAIAELK
jgi:hypothetical protein